MCLSSITKIKYNIRSGIPTHARTTYNSCALKYFNKYCLSKITEIAHEIADNTDNNK